MSAIIFKTRRPLHGYSTYVLLLSLSLLSGGCGGDSKEQSLSRYICTTIFDAEGNDDTEMEDEALVQEVWDEIAGGVAATVVRNERLVETLAPCAREGAFVSEYELTAAGEVYRLQIVHQIVTEEDFEVVGEIPVDVGADVTVAAVSRGYAFMVETDRGLAALFRRTAGSYKPLESHHWSYSDIQASYGEPIASSRRKIVT